jgi:hypothetical protein
MQLDIRTPITLMFGLLGIILTGYGFIKRGDPEMLKPALGININLWWGLVMIAFALGMFVWSKLDKPDISEKPGTGKH